MANYKGVPHVYDCEFDEIEDEFSDRYWLTIIEPDLLALVLEQWEIWLRWQSAFKQGMATLTEPRAVPSDRQRDFELKALIGNRLRDRSESSVLRRAEIRYRNDEYEVRWS